MKNLTTLTIIVLGTLYSLHSFATSYTWNGATSTAWGTGTNWTPNGVPGAADNVTIVTATNQPTYNGVAGVTNLTMTSGTLNLGGYTLNVTGTGTFNGGTITTGKINATGGSITFAGTTMSCKVTATIPGHILLNGSVFNDTTRLTKTGGFTTSTVGGNKFNGYTVITNQATAGWYLNNASPYKADTATNIVVFNQENSGTLVIASASATNSVFNEKVILNKKSGSNSSPLEVAPHGKVKFRDVIEVTNVTTNDIFIGHFSDGAVTLVDDATVTVGSAGYTGRYLYFRYWNKSNSTAINFTLTGTAIFSSLSGNIFNGNFTVNAPQIYTIQSTYNGNATFQKTGATDNWMGGDNKFNSEFSLTNNGTGAIGFGTGATPDTFRMKATFITYNYNISVAHDYSGHYFGGDVYLKALGTNGINVSNYGSATFNGNIYLTSTSSGSINFGYATTGTITLANGKSIIADTDGFNSGSLLLRRFTKNGLRHMNLNFGSSASVTMGPYSTINGEVNYWGGNFYLNGATFNGKANFTKTGTGNNTSSGGNVFNRSSVFTNQTSGNITFANTTGDDFNSDVTFTTTSSGSIYPGYNGISYYAGNITANGGSLLHFGSGSTYGMSVLDGNYHGQISGTTTTIRFKKLKINKPGGAGALLEHTINVTDSLIFTSGVISAKLSTVELNDNCKVTGAANSSHVEGKVKKTGNDAFIFPVGRNGFYRSIAISAPSSTSDNYTAEYFNKNSNSLYAHSSKDAALSAISTGEYWKLDQGTGSSNVSVTLTWDTIGPSCSFANTANLKVASWNGTSWKDKGNGGTTGNRASGTVVTSGASTTYGAYTLGTSASFYCVPCIAYAGPDTIYNIYFGDTVQLGQANPGGYAYLWTPSTDLSDDDISNPLAWPKEDVVYNLLATNSKGCAANDKIAVSGTPFCIEPDDYILTGNITYSGGNFINGIVPVVHPSYHPNAVEYITIYLSGTLTIDEDLFFSGTQIYLDKDSKIIVNETCTISDGAYLQACRNSMWDGIIVNEGAHLIFDDQSILEDAKTGVFLDRGTFLFSNAIFNKNFRHIYVLGDHTPYNPGVMWTNEFTCETIGLGTYETLLAPHVGERTHIGFELEGVMNLRIYDGIFENLDVGILAHDGPNIEIDENRMFKHLDAGIWGRRLQGVSVTNLNRFSDITGTAIELVQNPSASILIDNNRFNDPPSGAPIGAGIVLTNNHATPKVITNNIMNFVNNSANTGRGITVSQALPFIETADISNNEIYSAFKGINTRMLYGDANYNLGTTTVNIDENIITVRGTLNMGESGILIEGSLNNAVSRNDVSQATGTVNWKETGIRQELGHTNWLTCNDVHDIGRAIFVSGDVRPWNFLIKNEMEDNQTGIFLNEAIIGGQGFYGNPFDNKWNGTWDINNPSTVTSGDEADGNLSPFLVQNTGLPFEPSENYAINTAPFPVDIDDAATHAWTGAACPVIHQFIMPGANRKSLLGDMLNESRLGTTRKINLHWMSLYGIYKYVSFDTDMLGSAGIEDFYDSCFVSNMGKLDRAAEHFIKLSAGHAEAFRDTLDNMTPANNTEEMVRDVLQILYDNEADGVDSLSPAQVDDLIEIAERCPYDYGFGVYMARSLLLGIDSLASELYFNACEESPEPPSSKWEGEQDGDHEQPLPGNTGELFRLYPNPAGNTLISEYILPGDEEINAIFEMYDLGGRIVSTVNITANRTVISIEALDAGIYYYSFKVNGEIRYSGKQSIIK